MKAYFLGNATVSGTVFERSKWYEIDAPLLDHVRRSVILENEIDKKARENIVIPDKLPNVSLADTKSGKKIKGAANKGKPAAAEDK